MSKILSLFENRTFDVGLLTTVAAAAAIFGYHIDVTQILTVIAPIMGALGIAGWQSVATTQQETQIKSVLLGQGVKHDELHAAYLVAVNKAPAPGAVYKASQAGFVKRKLMVSIACFGLGVGAGFGTGLLVVTNTGCVAGAALGKCEVNVLDKQLPNSAGTVTTDLLDAIGGGDAGVIAALVATIENVFPGTLVCIGQFIDNLVTQYLVADSGSDAGSGSGALVVGAKYGLGFRLRDPVKARVGLAAFHDQLRKYKVPVNVRAAP